MARDTMQSACEFFWRGRCKFGQSCKYSHDPQTLCPRSTTRKGCTKGSNCPFSHNSSSAPSKAVSSAADGAIESSFRKWTYMIPLPKHSGSLLTKPDIPGFFQLGWELFSTSGTEIHQQVMRKLSSEEGARMVAALVDIMEQSSGFQLLACFNKAVLPLYSILSHPDVVSSLILEQSLGTIYNILYGFCGRRAIIVFRFTSQALELAFSDHTDKRIDLTTAVESCLNVLGNILEINQAAQILEELLPATETISTAIINCSTSFETQRQLDKIRTRLGLGSLVPTMTRSNTAPAKPVCFELSRDLPGELSEFGPRHDNDHHLIENIQILPTAQEIQSDRTEYLPLSDPDKSHHPGLRGLLDRQFRLLREESIGALRDAVGRELEMLGSTSAKSISKGGIEQKERANIYQNVSLVKWDIDRKKGLRLVVDFDQPIDLQNSQPKQREDWWQNSKRLQAGTLICLVTSSGRTLFLLVEDPSPTPPHSKPQEDEDEDADLQSQVVTAQKKYKRKLDEAPSLSGNRHRAAVMLRLVQNRPDDVIWTLSQMTNKTSSLRQSLVEFPGALLQSFQPPLEALQMMSRTLDIPFREFLAPEDMTSIPKVDSAAYSQAPGFSYDLSSLTHGAELNYTPGKEFDYEAFNNLTDLDRTQQNALIHTLSNSLALIQGPPGTGKSYTGVAIIKTLLGNRSIIKSGPIICVCYTNHALDQLLEHLIKDGVDQIIRVGSRSKSEVLQNLNLNFLTQRVEQTKTEKSEKWRLYRELDTLVRDIEMLLDEFHSFDSAFHMRKYLDMHHPDHFRQLFSSATDEEGFHLVRGTSTNNLNRWLRGSSKMSGSRPLEVLKQSDLWKMSRSERHDLHRYWTQQRSNDLIDRIIKAWDLYQETVRKLQSYTQEQQRRCLLEAKVIGITTTGLARNLDVLRRLKSKVLVNEEAGEVLEAHTLTALLPTVQHAILIGDHEQLRPQVKNYELRQDHPQGAQYSLDISLFERLVRPKLGNRALQYTSLKTQRRMHPSIADLVRNTIYSDLEDHSTVSLFPPVTGMQKRLFWLDHKHTEESSDPMFSKQFSKTNDFEVEMTSALVSHLIRQGTYPPGDIAVLTPYLGQLQKLKRLLSCSFDIVMSDRDMEDMQAQGFDLTSTQSKVQSSIKKSSLLNAVRVATVDNFQGEEAKVIILSFVRSNKARKCGFLNSSNRINVALSRARHGMFIIGNATTASSIPIWSQIISMLKQSGNFGDSLPLLCPRHPERPIQVRTTDDFVRFSPEGGCDRKCASRLLCGHACPNKCHSETLHDTVYCLERCQRTKAGCEHACPKPCGAPCDLKCQILLSNVLLPCGHTCPTLKCHKAQEPEELVKCQTKLEHVMSGCNHKVLVNCDKMPIGDDYDCSAICGAHLECGHDCTRPCKLCKTRRDGLIAEMTHGECRVQCGRPYATCRHSCESQCHNRNPEDTCPLCKRPCDVRCVHSKCNKRCNEPCVPCVEPCPWSCPHGKCQMPCAVPCDRLPCSERCHQVLPCGHRCPSLCGETCLDPCFCQVCGDQSIKSMVVDYIEMLTYGEVNLDANPCIVPDCGHIITLENLDELMSMKEFYEYDERGETITGIKSSSEPFSISGQKNCPSCRGPLRNINRYSRITRRAWIDEATKKFIVWANAKFVPLAAQVKALEEKLKSYTQTTRSPLSPLTSSGSQLSPLIFLGSHVDFTNDQGDQIQRVRTLTERTEVFQSAIRLRFTVRRFFDQVDKKQQPFSQIYDLVQDARRHRGIQHNMAWMPDMLQLRHRLLASVMLMRSDYAILATFLASCKDNKVKVNVNFSHQRKDCVALVNECQARDQPANKVEGHLFFARFIALERGFTDSMPEGSAPMISAHQHLDEAEALCIRYPEQTAGMVSEVNDARTMLRDSTFYMPVSNEEKAQVYAAMAADFRGTGHWYYCANGHPFTIGECGAPMQRSRCPQCGSMVGGERHQLVEGITRANDLEAQFGALRV